VSLFILFYKYFPLILVLGTIVYIVHKNNKKSPEEPPRRRPRIEEESTDYLAVQATMSDVQQVIDSHNDIIRSTDLRQFQGRSDVTKEELATYMFEQHQWNGAYERKTMMEEIIKYCNLTMDDVEWCMDRLNHYTYDDDPYHEYKACVVPSEEAKAILDYNNEQESAKIKQEVIKLIKDHKANLEFIKPDDTDGELAKIYTEQFNRTLRLYANQLRQCDYESWLKMKGYVQ
jgi:hypothetical protein